MGDEDSRKIFVGGTRDADEKTVEDYFQQFGAIESCKVGNVNLGFRPSDSYRQKMNLNMVDQKHFNRSVVIAGFASYFMHSFDAGLGLVC